MIEEDLHVARGRARRWDELTERRQLIDSRIQQVRQALNTTRVTQLEVRRGEETRVSSFFADLRAVEWELAKVGPAREVYEELLARKAQRLIESADLRGTELSEIARLLAELDVELPARLRARTAGSAAAEALAALTTDVDATADPGAIQAAQRALADFVRELEVLGMPGVEAPGIPDIDALSKPSSASTDPQSEIAAWVSGTMDELSTRCAELGLMREELHARREELLVD